MDHLSLVGIVPWEFVAQIANLLIQAALFKKFLFKPVPVSYTHLTLPTICSV